MRLTLRTLLAYLDDVLEPSETKLIGQKIQESAVAGKLISLIRLVVRQRRLKAPTISGPNVGIDPNVVAQYLDNTLSPEQVVEVEKVLLTSDELLAEVASCHQVLALVMGRPLEVSEASRERLYALGPVAQSDQLRVEEPAESALAAAASRDADRVNGAVRAPVPHEIPEYLRQSSWSQKVVPTSIVALLVLVCAGLLYMDPSLLRGARQVSSELGMNEREAAKTGDSSTNEAATTKPNADTTEVAAANPATNSELMSEPLIPAQPVTPQRIDPNPPEDAAEPPANPAKGAVTTRPADAAVAVKGANADAIPPSPGPAIPAEQPNGRAVSIQYTSSEGVMLHQDQQHWFQLPRRSMVNTGELLAVPEPFEATLDFDLGAVSATVLGDSALRILGPKQAAAFGMDIQRGRMVLRTTRKDVVPTSALTITVGDDSWTLELLSPDTICTLEIVPREPVQFEKALDQNWYLGYLRVRSGSVKWTSSEGHSQTIPTQTALEILPRQAGQGVKSAPVSSTFVPDWVDAQKRKQFPLRRFAPVFEKQQFGLDQPVEQNLVAAIKDPHVKISELAIRCLALIESPAALVQALAECDYEEGRFAARDGLRIWLGRRSDRGATLKGILESHYPGPEASAVYILLWGFRPEDGANRTISLELATFLKSTHVEIRELAYYWITQLSGRKWDFKAMDVLSRRDAVVRKIEAHIMKDGALTKPTDTPPNP